MPHKFGEIPPPGKPGDGKARPVRKISSSPETGTVVVQVLVLLLNEVVEQLALKLKTITPLGTVAENALNVTVEPQKVIVAPEDDIPLALIWALNQMVSPTRMVVPLKFDWMHDDTQFGHGNGVGVGIGVGVGQLRKLGENMIGMVLNPSNVAEPEKLLLPPMSLSDWVILVLKLLPLAVKGIELLTVIRVPDGGVTMIW
jgi:hypothetical protein